MFYKIQGYSFENIDKFSVSSLVTRLTTDITNVQMAYMMIIRTAVRSPLMLIFSFIMGFVMGGKMAWIFLVIIPFPVSYTHLDVYKRQRVRHHDESRQGNPAMNTPVVDFVRRYGESGISRLHMPGHKGQPFLGFESWDITEIQGADALFEAEGILRESEENATGLFGSRRTFYSTEGSSLSLIHI